MKKTLFLIHLLAGGTSLIAQGTINLDSYFPGRYATTFYSLNYSNPTAPEISGNNNYWDLPPANTSYANETPLGGTSSGVGPGPSGEYNGNNYTVGFYFATALTALQTLVNTGSPSYTISLDTIGGAGYTGA